MSCPALGFFGDGCEPSCASGADIAVEKVERSYLATGTAISFGLSTLFSTTIWTRIASTVE